MAITAAQSVSVASTAQAKTTTLTLTGVTSGRSIVLICSTQYPVTAVTDSRGNTYTQDIVKNPASGAGSSAVWRASNVAAGTTIITITLGTTGHYLLAAQEITANLVPLKTAGATGTGTSITVTLTGQTLNVSQYIAAGFNAQAQTSTTITDPIGWTIRKKSTGGAVGVPLGEARDKIETSTAVTTSSWTIGASRTWTTVVASYGEAPTVSSTAPVEHSAMPNWLLPEPIPDSIFWYFAQMDGTPGYAPPPTPRSRPRKKLTVAPVPELKDQTRLERTIREIADMINDLSRSQQLFLSELGKFAIRGQGFDKLAAPTADDDGTTGARVGSTWVDNTDPDAPRLYVCVSTAVGNAGWREVKLKPPSTESGATGAFPK